MCNKGGGDDQSCCEKCKDCCGRIPIVSMIAACIMVASFTMLAVCVELGLKPLDDAFKIIRADTNVLRKQRNMIVLTMRAASIASYAFVGFFVAIAFTASGKSRQCLRNKKCCRRHIVFFIIILMIVMAVIYFLTLISVAVIGIPLTFATSTIKSCDIITDESTKELCFSPLFLGSDLKLLCKGSQLLDRLCDDMMEVAKYAWICFFTLIVANIGLVLGIGAMASNYAYVRSEGKFGEKERDMSGERGVSSSPRDSLGAMEKSWDEEGLEGSKRDRRSTRDRLSTRDKYSYRSSTKKESRSKQKLPSEGEFSEARDTFKSGERLDPKRKRDSKRRRRRQSRSDTI